jgi:hypothetical protein
MRAVVRKWIWTMSQNSSNSRKTFKFAAAITALIVLCGGNASANDQKWNVGVETGAVWQQRNDVQNPGDSGTRFSLVDVVGDGPFAFYRLELFYDLAPRHQLRFLIAPFRYEESGVLDKDVFFVDETFSAGQETQVTYQFNSYRATYRYRFYDKGKWRMWVGGTVKIRDAEIALQQDGISARDTDVGFVPLVNFYGDYQFARRWRLILDFDGLLGPQGRALDAGLKVHYDLTRHWYAGGGYRTLEGGVDNDTVFNFAWYNYAVLSFGYRF